MKYKNANITSRKTYYTIDSIITRKIIGKNKFYLIKWKGYSLLNCTWEPISNLSNVIDMVEEFDKNYPYSIEIKTLKLFNILYKKYKNKRSRKKKLNNNTKNSSNNNKIIIDLSDSDFNINEEGEKIENKIDKNSSDENDENGNDISEKLTKDCSTCEKDKEPEGKIKLIEPVLIW